MTTKVETWAKEADQGSRFVYHVGAHAGGDECHAARDLYEGGLVLLFRQRKENKSSMFYYVAQRTGKKL
jgi:hypothetical protein